MNMPLTQIELRKLCATTECRVAMWRGNVCYKAEQKWPRTMYKKRTYNDLTVKEQRVFNDKMMKYGTRLYHKSINIKRVKRYCRGVTRNTLVPFWQERFLKERYYRVTNAVANDANDMNDIKPIFIPKYFKFKRSPSR